MKIRVKKKDIIAMSGDSGNVTEPHLHYEVIENDKHVDPEKYIK